MISNKLLINIVFFLILPIFLTGCNGKLPGADARKFPDDPKKELQKI